MQYYTITENLQEVLNAAAAFTPLASFAFDSVWLLAQALNGEQTSGSSRWTTCDSLEQDILFWKCIISSYLENVSFEGITVSIKILCLVYG